MTESAAFLAQACPSESKLLSLICGELEPAAVSRLLAHTEACSSCALVVAEAGLALGDTESFPASCDSSRSTRSVFTVGQLVAGRYQIERRVGRGGMGEVYAAFDQELHDRVALKTISPAFAADPKSVDRFKQELRLARRISHPSVCRVLEFGRHELPSGTSQCFFTLQFIEGATLRHRLLERGAFELPLAIKLAIALAEGLQAIHDQNVVHRDVKPENVMLPAEPGASAVWVDFGLARVDLRETRSTAVVAGTPDYAAPELLQGDMATRVSDIYAFGVVLFELLTGTLPFPRSSSFSDAFARPRAPASPPSALRGDLPSALDALVLECIDAAPGHRPSSAEQVARRLRAISFGLARTTPETPDHLADSEPALSWKWLLALGAGLSALFAAAALSHHLSNAAPVGPAPLSTTSPLASSPPLPPMLALDPPSPERRLQPKRPASTPAPSNSRATAPVASEHPPVTDFGGRR